MAIRISYSGLPSSRRMNIMLFRILVLIFLIFCIVPPNNLFGQNDPDEISVFLDVPGLGAGEIDAFIQGQNLFLPVTDLFDFLKIRNIPSEGLETISGFFISPEATYTISRTDNKIVYQGKNYDLEPTDLIRTESNLYLKSSYFGKVFGLSCSFNFRSLSVTVISKLELPLIREMRLEEMRENLKHLKGGVSADTSIKQSRPLFKFGMADWSVLATEEPKGQSETNLNLGLGAMIAGGEATAALYYNSKERFSEKQQQYLWRYVNNDFKPLRQIIAGKIITNSIASIYNPVIGVQFTNTPTTYRRSFGTYTLSDRTEPGWIVELYVNSVLVDYVKADASGFFTFQVPLVYGNSIVRLKFFGPWGEEKIREQNINIPFNFLPVNTMEYTVSAGIVEDSVASRISRANVNYGVTRNLTAGVGIEYLSSLTANPAMPFFNASYRITNNLLLTGEYNYKVRAKGTLSYRLPSNLQLDINYTWYDKNQKAINFNYREERKAALSMPLKIGKLATYQRFSIYQIVLPDTKYTTGEWLFSGSVLGASTNLTTYAIFVEQSKTNIYSNLSLALRLPANFVLMPQIQYEYMKNKVISARLGLEKHILKHAFLNMSYEHLFINNSKLAEVGLRYDFSFAQTGVSMRQTGNKSSFVQYARGSIINDTKTKYVGVDNRSNVGKGGISIVAFLDINSNGKKDTGEPKAEGLNIRANGGRVERSDRDTTIRILNLESYTDCFIELDQSSFDNISWKLPYQTINVAVDPNIIKSIEIPISVVGEASGKVLLEKDGEYKGLGRIIIVFYGNNMRYAAKILTEDDGYFSYLGLTPGKYTVKIDTSQLRRLGMISEPGSHDIVIEGGIDGDVVDGIDFNLSMIPVTKTETEVVTEKPVVRKDTTYLVVHEVTQELVTIQEDSWAIQMGAFRKKSYAESLKRKVEKALQQKVDIIVEDNYYKVRVSDIKTRDVVDKDLALLHQNGINEVWVISLKAKKQQWVLKEKQDSVIKVNESVSDTAMFAISPATLVQLGAFRNESNALALRNLVSSKFDGKVEIVNEGGYYKVRLAAIPLIDQTVLDVMKNLDGSIGKLSLKDFWVLPPRLQPSSEKPMEEKPVIIREKAPEKVEIKTEIPTIVKADSTQVLNETKIAPIEIKPEPTISLQVAVFHKESEALRAQKKIMSKLKLPVKIIKQYEYYHVIVTGFYTREETYKYYPELAGLGFPGITLIEDK
jgi:cell division protein FtsN